MLHGFTMRAPCLSGCRRHPRSPRRCRGAAEAWPAHRLAHPPRPPPPPPSPPVERGGRGPRQRGLAAQCQRQLGGGPRAGRAPQLCHCQRRGEARAGGGVRGRGHPCSGASSQGAPAQEAIGAPAGRVPEAVLGRRPPADGASPAPRRSPHSTALSACS